MKRINLPQVKGKRLNTANFCIKKQARSSVVTSIIPMTESNVGIDYQSKIISNKSTHNSKVNLQRACMPVSRERKNRDEKNISNNTANSIEMGFDDIRRKPWNVPSFTICNHTMITQKPSAQEGSCNLLG